MVLFYVTRFIGDVGWLYHRAFLKEICENINENLLKNIWGMEYSRAIWYDNNIPVS